MDEVKAVLANFGIAIKSVNLSKDVKSNSIQIESVAKVFQDRDLDIIVGTISKTDGVADFQIHQ